MCGNNIFSILNNYQLANLHIELCHDYLTNDNKANRYTYNVIVSIENELKKRGLLYVI